MVAGSMGGNQLILLELKSVAVIASTKYCLVQ
jgi:hypothetical protein